MTLQKILKIAGTFCSCVLAWLLDLCINLYVLVCTISVKDFILYCSKKKRSRWE